MYDNNKISRGMKKQSRKEKKTKDERGERKGEL